MNQLANPNLSAVGRIDYCLEYQSRVWGTTHNEPYAWNAWMATKHPHTDAPPTDVSYPLWFSFYVNGLNEGHVVTFVPGQGYYSSPYQLGTTHAVLSSIAEVERIYGVKYVGWSEDILEKQVIGGNMDVITTAQQNALVRMQTGDFPGPGFNGYAGNPGTQANWDKLIALVESLPRGPKLQPGAGTLPAGTYIQVDPKDIKTI